jgi:hypothetical protein
MDNPISERRKETRYSIHANVLVHRSDGETLRAKAANISGGGMLIEVDPPAVLVTGEEVEVEVEVRDVPGKPFACWGLAKVVRSEGSHFGVQLTAATFTNQDLQPPEA